MRMRFVFEKGKQKTPVSSDQNWSEIRPYFCPDINLETD